MSGDDGARVAAFTLLGAAQAIVYLTLALWTGYHDRPGVAMALALLAFALYLAAHAAARPLSGRLALAFAVILGLIFRASLFPEAPFFSDDHFRYLWDGLLQLRGINPYRYAPADPALAGIDEALRAQVNHPTVPTIYPPLAQIAFALVALSGAGWVGLKTIWLACDIAIAALLYRMVSPQRRLAALTLYWWSPLVVIEVAWNAHLDLLGALPLVVAIWLASRAPPRSVGVGLTVAAAALVKYFAILDLPAAANRGRLVRTLATFTLAVVALYLPYLAAGPGLFGGLGIYADVWRFNDGLFAVLAWTAGSESLAKAVAAAIVLALVLQSVRNDWTLEKTAFWVTGAILLLSPTVHPWYLLWMVPLIALRPNRAWLYLSGSVFLAYYGLGTYRAEGVWPEPWWQKAAIYVPFLLLLMLDGWRGSWWQAAWKAFRAHKLPESSGN